MHPILVNGLTHYFEPAEIAMLLAERARHAKHADTEGEIAAKTFALFDARSKTRDVVIDLRQTPEKILALHAQWLRMGREMLLREDDRNALYELLGAPFRSPRDLIDLVGRLVREVARVDGDRSTPSVTDRE